MDSSTTNVCLIKSKEDPQKIAVRGVCAGVFAFNFLIRETNVSLDRYSKRRCLVYCRSDLPEVYSHLLVLRLSHREELKEAVRVAHVYHLLTPFEKCLKIAALMKQSRG